jgi:hypothetical protein
MMHLLHFHHSNEKERRFKDNNAGKGFTLEGLDIEIKEEERNKKNFSIPQSMRIGRSRSG